MLRLAAEMTKIKAKKLHFLSILRQSVTASWWCPFVFHNELSHLKATQGRKVKEIEINLQRMLFPAREGKMLPTMGHACREQL